jgi:hypothetical protein
MVMSFWLIIMELLRWDQNRFRCMRFPFSPLGCHLLHGEITHDDIIIFNFTENMCNAAHFIRPYNFY